MKYHMKWETFPETSKSWVLSNNSLVQVEFLEFFCSFQVIEKWFRTSDSGILSKPFKFVSSSLCPVSSKSLEKLSLSFFPDLQFGFKLEIIYGLRDGLRDIWVTSLGCMKHWNQELNQDSSFRVSFSKMYLKKNMCFEAWHIRTSIPMGHHLPISQTQILMKCMDAKLHIKGLIVTNDYD